jgi:hypothetical protein
MSKDGNHETPVMQLKPRLWTMILATLAVEAVFMLVIFLVLSAIKKRFKTPGNTFVIDDALIRRIGIQYASTLALLIPLGVTVGYVMQSCADLRYRDDGLRGIRALSVLLLILCFTVVLVVP